MFKYGFIYMPKHLVFWDEGRERYKTHMSEKRMNNAEPYTGATLGLYCLVHADSELRQHPYSLPAPELKP